MSININAISPDGEGQKFTTKFAEPIVLPQNANIRMNFVQFERNTNIFFSQPQTIRLVVDKVVPSRHPRHGGANFNKRITAIARATDTTTDNFESLTATIPKGGYSVAELQSVLCNQLAGLGISSSSTNQNTRQLDIVGNLTRQKLNDFTGANIAGICGPNKKINLDIYELMVPKQRLNFTDNLEFGPAIKYTQDKDIRFPDIYNQVKRGPDIMAKHPHYQFNLEAGTDVFTDSRDDKTAPASAANEKIRETTYEGTANGATNIEYNCYGLGKYKYIHEAGQILYQRNAGEIYHKLVNPDNWYDMNFASAEIMSGMQGFTGALYWGAWAEELCLNGLQGNGSGTAAGKRACAPATGSHSNAAIQLVQTSWCNAHGGHNQVPYDGYVEHNVPQSFFGIEVVGELGGPDPGAMSPANSSRINIYIDKGLLNLQKVSNSQVGCRGMTVNPLTASDMRLVKSFDLNDIQHMGIGADDTFQVWWRTYRPVDIDGNCVSLAQYSPYKTSLPGTNVSFVGVEDVQEKMYLEFGVRVEETGEVYKLYDSRINPEFTIGISNAWFDYCRQNPAGNNPTDDGEQEALIRCEMPFQGLCAMNKDNEGFRNPQLPQLDLDYRTDLKMRRSHKLDEYNIAQGGNPNPHNIPEDRRALYQAIYSSFGNISTLSADKTDTALANGTCPVVLQAFHFEISKELVDIFSPTNKAIKVLPMTFPSLYNSVWAHQTAISGNGINLAAIAGNPNLLNQMGINTTPRVVNFFRNFYGIFENEKFTVKLLGIGLKEFKNQEDKSKPGVRVEALAECPLPFPADAMTITAQNIGKVVGSYSNANPVTHFLNNQQTSINHFRFEVLNMEDNSPAEQITKCIVNFTISAGN